MFFEAGLQDHVYSAEGMARRAGRLIRARRSLEGDEIFDIRDVTRTATNWSFGAVPRILAMLVIFIPLVYGVIQVQNSALRTNLALFEIFMGSPLQLLLPLVAIGVGCSGLYREVGHRYVVYLLVRMGLRKYLMSRLLYSSVVPFLVMTIAAILIFFVSFVIWSMIGNPFIDPSVYFVSADNGAASDLQSFSYSQLMAFGAPTFGVIYAIWFGCGAAIYGALGAASLIITSNRSLAILVPMGIYLLETIAAALLGDPHAGLMYSLFPFGLRQTAIADAAAPTLILGVAVTGLWIWIFHRPSEATNLL